jgi:hypothetical protein
MKAWANVHSELCPVTRLRTILEGAWIELDAGGDEEQQACECELATPVADGEHRYYVAHDGVFIDPENGTTDAEKALALATMTYDELRGPGDPDPLVTVVIGIDENAAADRVHENAAQIDRIARRSGLR